MGEVRILGAGLSGMSAAINLKKLGRDVVIYEKKPKLGSQHEDLQGLADIVDPEPYLKGLNIDIKPQGRRFPKITFCTPTRELNLLARKVGKLVFRGGSRSLEQDIYEYAEKAGVRFEFNANKTVSDVDIVATGPPRCDALAVGAVYENTGFDRDRMLVMFDDKYSPKGCYLYVLSTSDDRVEIINCALAPYAPDVRKLLLKAIEEKKFLREIADGKAPIGYFSCTVNFNIPKTAVVDGKLYVGEAAGFQDASVGTGMRYALESGKMAAESIVYNKDYDAMWKQAFLPTLKASFARRFALSTFGDKAVDFVLKGLKDGDYLDVDGTIQSAYAGAAEKILFSAARIKNLFTGRWY